MNDHQGPQSRNGNGGWRAAALTAVGTFLFGMIGWVATDATNARSRMADDLAAQAQRIAVLEESNRNVRESQARIEKVLDDIRQQIRRR